MPRRRARAKDYEHRCGVSLLSRLESGANRWGAADLGEASNLLTQTGAATLTAHTGDDPAGPTLVSLAEELEPGSLVVQDGALTRGRVDGRCLAWGKVAPHGHVLDVPARVAQALGSFPTQTDRVTYQTGTMALLDRQGRRSDWP